MKGTVKMTNIEETTLNWLKYVFPSAYKEAACLNSVILSREALLVVVRINKLCVQ